MTSFARWAMQGRPIPFGPPRPLAGLLNSLGYVFTPYAWLGHVLLGVAIQIAAAVPLHLARVRAAWWIAAALSAGFFWGREKMEYEYAMKAAAGLRTVAPFWWRGWMPWDWGIGGSNAWEFLAPAAACLLVAWCVDRATARRSRRVRTA